MFNIDEIYTISNFLFLCNKTIEDKIPTCWLQGEISNLTRPESGHWYFSLKDSKAQVYCVLFRFNQRHIKFNPKNGMEVLVHVTPTLYKARGNFQLIIQHLEPVGIGNLNLAFEQLKNKLVNEGLFDNIHKKPLPNIINTIGVISSSTGAVIQDIIKVLNNRYPFSDILLFDSMVQGQGSVKKLTNALNAADQSGKCDVIIIARGGGSLEDLWAFNEETLARAIFKASTPIISAIGHETDTTISDFVCDICAPTPSAAAMLVTPDRLELLANTDKLYMRLHQSYQQTLHDYQSVLNQLKLRIPISNKQIAFFSQKLDHVSINLNNHVKSTLVLNNAKLNSIFSALKQHSPIEAIKHIKILNQVSFAQLKHQIKQIININNSALYLANEKLKKAIATLTDKHKTTLSIQANSLHHLSPLNTLSRGFSITTNAKNQILSSITDIKINQAITTQLADGKLYSNIKKIEKN
ncbi:exodeoxyribonuclease VII, large subunit [Candidatus Ruthia magnifica str. Cm (Calyptogena magnifica)]|uniref:Exodeoxyribonuclease 7 large subunit n=1 Tax=Ruthia magnifica subsp. Calyptogena magnifica TaxID=413404 RepID=EX7L_RUTMC|nr:exodeoxyribonuclease VII large subunit [Candidatus Ruthturnera calyptogenae]A1AX20.1 RecName: Full=Exodeoxyribonuclease 7 large subunit; AltName: Full=Exodeoxyribonuclease VII large subunit; Short=Exonuclease VII large subunit [Candidatus Ruthia magnifica str. Cm (Calyptogena magnifica)]ABL02477.1 exodeoxyribonuclease VII, large subunit [Candidatus Ruthia magnifica str. Cm (Calyptogena magnifica)]